MTVMAEGSVLAEGKPAAIRASVDVQEAYLGEAH
jgi:ABC-type branched-subunit amino acid transport system ATPase component